MDKSKGDYRNFNEANQRFNHPELGGLIGSATFESTKGDKNEGEVGHVHVDENHRRKGIASEMYKLFEKSTGMKAKPSTAQYENAKKLWAQPNRPFGKSEELDKGAKGDWQKEGYKIKNLPYKDFIKKFPKYSESNSLMPHHIVSNADEVHYALSPDKKIIGHLAVKEHGPYLLPVDSFVKEEHRRKGIANELYSTAELYHGLSLEPSDNPADQSADAEALWAQPNRPFGKSESNLIDEIKKDLLNLRKTLTAGMGNAAPSSLVGGSALSVEDKQNKKNINVLKSVIRDFQGRTKEDFKKAVKEALPDLSDKYVDHFVDLAEDLSLKKFNKRLY